MLRFAVCDDEPAMLNEAAARLSEYMDETGRGWTLSRFSSGRELLDSAGTFDLVLLDVRMARPDGMETAKLLRERGFHGLLIFITVLRDSVFDSFDAAPFDYLVKPLDAGRFRRTMDRAIKTLEEGKRRTVAVRRGNTCRVVPLDEVLFCEVMGRKLYLHCVQGEVVDYYGRLEDLERQAGRQFFRCHRSFLVNLDQVRGYAKGAAALAGGGRVPVSRLRERELLEALLGRMKSGEGSDGLG